MQNIYDLALELLHRYEVTQLNLIAELYTPEKAIPPLVMLRRTIEDYQQKIEVLCKESINETTN